MEGWIKLHRKIIDDPIFQNEKLLKVWLYCLLKASHKEHESMVGMQLVKVKPGEFVFGRKKAAVELNMKESTVWDRIKLLEKIGNININSNNKFSVINVVNWGKHQDEKPELQQQSRQQPDNNPTTAQQQSNTNKNVKNDKNEKNKDIYSPVVNYLNEKAGTNFKASSKATQRLIDARLNEKFSEDDFKKVIDNKVNEWSSKPDMIQYLRPNTLFGTKFEGYLNQKQVYKDTNERPTSEYDNFF